MMARVYVVALVVLLAGCQPKENTEQLKAVNKSLEFSNDIIKEAGKQFLIVMESNHREYPRNEKADMWLQIMNKIKTETDSLAGIVEDIKAKLVIQSDNLKIENVAELNSLSEPTGDGYNLLNKLTSFKESIPSFFNIPGKIDYPTFYTVLNKDLTSFRKASPLLADYAESLSEAQRNEFINKWLNKNLRGSSALMAMIVLNKLENDILTTRTMLMDYCSKQVGILDERGLYTWFSSIK